MNSPHSSHIPSLVRRLWLLVAVLAVTLGGAFAFLQWASSAETGELRGHLDSLPMEINAWVGEDKELDEHVARRVGALESISRVYKNSANEVISVHVACWSALGEPTLPHPPKVCYPSAGAMIMEEKSVEIMGDEGDSIQAKLMLIERGGAKNLVLYWYFWDQYVVATRTQATLARLRLAGSRQWPPVVKVLLDAPVGLSEERTREQLIEFAGEVRRWSKDL